MFYLPREKRCGELSKGFKTHCQRRKHVVLRRKRADAAVLFCTVSGRDTYEGIIAPTAIMSIERETDRVQQARWLEDGLQYIARQQMPLTPMLCDKLLDRRIPRIKVLQTVIEFASSSRSHFEKAQSICPVCAVLDYGQLLNFNRVTA